MNEYPIAQQFHSYLYAWRKCLSYAPGDKYKSVNSSIVHNKPKLEASQLTINTKMAKLIVIYLYNIQNGTEKKLITATCYNMHQPHQHTFEFQKPVLQKNPCYVITLNFGVAWSL